MDAPSRGQWLAAFAVAALLLGLSLLVPRGVSAAAPEIVVCPECGVRTIGEALAQAPPGARVVVRAGTYAEQVVIDRPVTLVGEGQPVIQGNGQGTVVTITAPDVTIEGFTVRGSGTDLNREDSGILATTGPVVVANNRVEDALFGIYLKSAHGSVVRDNVVLAKPLPISLRGDGIRIWYSNNTTIERNIARDGRDVILWFSHDGVVRDNLFDRNRYGLHLMYSDRATIERNSLRANAVGLYVMYSREVVVTGNLMNDNHGPSGMGLGIKGSDDVLVEGNRLVSNRIGAQIDESAREMTSSIVIRGNVFAYNGIGIGFLPSAQRNTVTGNDFIDNIEQVGILGGGSLRDITWSENGRGNYWSDYVGYDADGDGIGDVPYRSQRLFESLIDRNEALRLFQFSPAETAIDFAARAFPEVRPQVKLEDTAPLMRPVMPEGLPPTENGLSTQARVVTGAAGVVVAIGGVVMIGALRRRPTVATAQPAPAVAGAVPAGVPALAHATNGAAPPAAVAVRGLTKRYGRVAAVDGVNFDVRGGEAIALWGPNGAGKTTILRCLLGIARFEGEVRVAGLDPRRDGRETRRRIGFVPQELPIPGMTVGEFAHFIAELKGVPASAAFERLELLGIGDQTAKDVGALSGGMRQRLALALALIGDPALLLLDEPTANLDARGRAELLELLRGLKRQGMTMIFSSHRPEDVLMLADRILLIERGALRGEITPEQFLERLERDARLVLHLAEGEAATALAALDRLGYQATARGDVVEVVLGGQPKGRVVGALARAGVAIEDFEMERGSWTEAS